MLKNLLDPGVLIIGLIALAITLLSIYVSRVYLPMKLKMAYKKSILTLATAVEMRESGSVGHAERVAEVAVNVAQKLGVKGRDLERIEYAALLMDVGKANVPQRLLQKKEPLAREEWSVLQTHSRLSAEMVAAVPFLADISDYVLYHHEYWDGSGYPKGLKGEEIPLPSRILAIASDYDAMISERAYHVRPLTRQEARDEICRGISVKYDPAVADVFLEIIAVEDSAFPYDIAAVG